MALWQYMVVQKYSYSICTDSWYRTIIFMQVYINASSNQRNERRSWCHSGHILLVCLIRYEPLSLFYLELILCFMNDNPLNEHYSLWRHRWNFGQLERTLLKKILSCWNTSLHVTYLCNILDMSTLIKALMVYPINRTYLNMHAAIQWTPSWKPTVGYSSQ